METVAIRPIPGKAQNIDHKIFGSFIEHIENCIQDGILEKETGKFRQDVVEICRNLKTAVLRFPGGTVTGIYHWEDDIGPLESRKHRRNLTWGGMMEDRFGTAEFITFCRQIGAEPMLCVNMPSGTPEEAANWVEYCNGAGHTFYADLRRSHGYEEPFNVRYWCIGNESFSIPDLGMQDDVKTYTRQAWEFTKFMKMTDPEIELVFVGNICSQEWNREIMDSLWEVCDFLSLHYYANSANAQLQLKELEEKHLPAVEQLLSEYNNRPIQIDRWYRIPPRKHDTWIAMDEWNIWDGDPDGRSPYGVQQRYTWRDALWCGSFLSMLIRKCNTIRIANLAQLVNVLAPIIVEGGSVWKQTIYYPFALFSGNCGQRYIPCETEHFGQMSIALSENEKSCYLFIVNAEDQPKSLHLPYPADRIKIMQSDQPDMPNSMDREHVKVKDSQISGNNEAFIPPVSICLVYMPDRQTIPN